MYIVMKITYYASCYNCLVDVFETTPKLQTEWGLCQVQLIALQ